MGWGGLILSKSGLNISRSELKMSGARLKQVEIDGSGQQMSENKRESRRVDGTKWEQGFV